VWCGQKAETALVELLLRGSGDEERLIACTDPIVRIGSGGGCHIALPGEFAPEVCELRAEEEGWVLVDLGMGGSVLQLEGHEVSSHERLPLAVGDRLKVGEYNLEVTFAGRRKETPKVSVLTREVLAPRELDRVFSAQPIEWVDLRVGEQDCFIRLDTSWTRFAYRALGYPLPDDSVDLGNEVDRGVTLFVLEKIIDELRREAGVGVECRGYMPTSYVKTDVHGEPRQWVAGVFDVRLNDEALQVVVLWPWQSLAQNPLPLNWARKLEFPISVLGGSTRLSPAELSEIEVGDVILPDRWTLQRGPDGIAVGGRVHLRIQDWNREADLRVRRGGHAVVLRSNHWNRSAEGTLMPSDQVEPLNEELEEAAPRAIEDEIELTLAFELDRISVPMNELSEWQEGSTVVLKKTPDDTVRVLLQHGGGSQVVGRGRVVQIEGQLGVRLEEWWPQHEENSSE